MSSSKRARRRRADCRLKEALRFVKKTPKWTGLFVGKMEEATARLAKLQTVWAESVVKPLALRALPAAENLKVVVKNDWGPFPVLEGVQVNLDKFREMGRRWAEEEERQFLARLAETEGIVSGAGPPPVEIPDRPTPP